ncbi:DUF4240 domain-containing protein [Leptotrichia sp. oral taxon 223]|nr:DUF4240 domain-containing protein [Leptotrichia sp. oral taxon 223]
MSIRNFATKLKMKREEFWKYISISHKKAKNNNEFVDYLIDILSKKTDEEIFDFEIITFELMRESYNEKLWCASYLVNGDTASWSFDFFRLWLISQGKKIYYSIIKNQDNLSKYINISFEAKFMTNYFENETFAFIPAYAFSRKNCSHNILSKESYKINSKTIFQDDFIDDYNKKLNNYKRKIGYINKKYPKIIFHWCTQFPNSMKEVCPTLFKKMYF